MPYAIMRAEKLKTFGNVAASLQHCFRERETPNADAARTPDNVHHAARSTDEAMGKSCASCCLRSAARTRCWPSSTS